MKIVDFTNPRDKSYINLYLEYAVVKICHLEGHSSNNQDDF